MTLSRTSFQRFLLPLVLLALGAVFCAILIPAESRAVQQQFISIPDSDVRTHSARPMILAVLCFLPALAALCYVFGQTLDRYIARQFAGIFGICLSALVMIWLLLDLSNNITEFKSSEHPLRTMLEFYGTLAPAIFMLLLPYSLLLAALYSLGQLSTHREITAMVQAGRGVFRIVLPIIFCGIFFTLCGLGLNYHWAPIAEGSVDAILKQAVGKPAMDATNVLYHNPENRRLWRIGAFPADYESGKPLLDLDVTSTDAQGNLTSRLYAKTALWDRGEQQWTMNEAVIGHFKEGQPSTFETFKEPLKMPSWQETPWQLIKPGLDATYLGIPDLTTWLKSNTRTMQADPAPFATQWHYRLALPFSCLVTVLLATPLAINFSRRSSGSGVFLAMVLSALLLLFSNISLSLGEAGTLKPIYAAWLPNLCFILLGFYLFWSRLSGRTFFQSVSRFFSPRN